MANELRINGLRNLPHLLGNDPCLPSEQSEYSSVVLLRVDHLHLDDEGLIEATGHPSRGAIPHWLGLEREVDTVLHLKGTARRTRGRKERGEGREPRCRRLPAKEMETHRSTWGTNIRAIEYPQKSSLGLEAPRLEQGKSQPQTHQTGTKKGKHQH